MRRSNYAAAPTLAAFNREARREDVRSVGVVATPCQALALAKMRASPLENRNNVDKLSLVIGLFCTWALDYSELRPLPRREDAARPHNEARHPAAAGQRLPGLLRLDQRLHPARRRAPLHPALLQRLPRHDGGVRGRVRRRRRRHRRLEHADHPQRARPGARRSRARRRRHRDGRSAGREPEPSQGRIARQAQAGAGEHPAR